MAGPWEKYGAQPAAPSPAPDAPMTVGTPRPKEHFRPLNANDGPLYLGDRPGIINEQTGEVKYGPAPAKGDVNPDKQRDQARSLLTAAGVDLEKGIDPVAPLIMGSTSGRLQHLGAEAYGAVSGHATSGMEDIGKLKPIVSDMVLQLTGGGLGNQVSDADRKFIIERVGNLADPDVPADQRLASWESVKQRMANILGVKLASTNTQPPAGDDVKRQMDERLRRGDDPADIIQWLVSIKRPPNKDEIAAILANRGNPSADSQFSDRPPDNGGGGAAARALGVGAGGVAEGVGDMLGVVSNPFIRAANYVLGTDIPADMGANVRDTLGLPAPQTDQEKLVSTINNYGTQALGFANAARLAAGKVPGVIGDALEAFGNRPLTDSASAATGGAASDLTRQAGGGPFAQAVAAVAAGVPTALVGSKLAAAAQGARAVPEVVKAGEQEGVSVPRAMADRSIEPKVITTGKTVAGSKIMRRDMGRVGDQIEARAQSLGDGGTPLEPFNMGEQAQNIGKRYIQTTGAQFNRRYEQLRNASQDVPIKAGQSIEYIDGLLSRLNKTPDTNAKEIAYLNGVRNDLSRGLDVESARDIGSRLSRDIRKGDVTFGPMEKDVLGLRQAVSGDIANGLAAAGKGDVAAQFQRVDSAYQQRMSFVRNTIQKLTGPRDKPLSPEKAAARIVAWAGPKGDSASLAKFMEQAAPEERSDIAATFADSLGKNNKGEFSTAIFANNAQRLPRAARKTIFGEDGTKSLDNLLLLAREHDRVSKALGGSPTGLANDARSWVMHALFGSGGALLGGSQGGGAGAAAGAAAVLAAKIGRDAFSAKSLMSPKITSWLRLAPKTNDPKAVGDWINRLKVIAVREPALGPDVQRIQGALVGGANQNITPALAASEPDQGKGNE